MLTSSSPDDDDGSARGAVTRAIQRANLDQLVIGTVLVGLALLSYAATETHGVVRGAGLLIGALAVVVPVLSWRQRWSHRTSWLALIPLWTSVIAVLAWVAE